MYLFTIFTSAVLVTQALGACLPCSNATFTKILAGNPNARLNFVYAIPQNGSFGVDDPNTGFPGNATQLPALCAINVNVKSSANSSYNFGLFLPDTTWNERLTVVGNGGYGGGINWLNMGVYVQYGFATVSTDTGHVSPQTDGTWGFNAPETLIDWGHRALHGSTVLSKTIIRSYYRSPMAPKYSYYIGCSTGGRQGITNAKYYPEDYDGISVGSPAWQITRLSPATSRAALLNVPSTDPKFISLELIPTIIGEITRQCDPQDGVTDGIINDPFGCKIDYEKLLCTNRPRGSACLNPAQLGSVKTFYSDWLENNNFIFPGFTLGTDPSLIWSGSVTTMGSDYWRYWVYNDTNFDYTQINYENILDGDRVNPGQATLQNFDFSPFFKRGGKIFLHHGDADEIIPANSSVYLYDQIRKAVEPKGIRVNDQFRFFQIPGAGHCRGSAVAPWVIGSSDQFVGATHSVPGFSDPKHDSTLALMKWVERGIAPERIIATKFKNDTYTNGVQSQRPICQYPKRPSYTRGDVNEASSWTCN